MNFDLITENNGFVIAGTGMLIVFIALTLISVFIALLPKVLAILSFVLPPEEAHSHPKATQKSTDEDEVAVAITFALHQVEMNKQRS